MKVYIVFQKTSSPTGGGNQFLMALEKTLALNGACAKNPNEASVVLFNSHHFIPSVAIAKRRFSNKIFVHRIDGPMRLYNSTSDKRDHLVNMASQMIADGTIFQSQWSKNENYRLNLYKNSFDTVIHNAVDADLFNRKGKKTFSMDRKIRIIANSWSTNPRKGFYVYEWLDTHLDFSKFEMTFIGNSPIKFRNINHIGPLPSKELAQKLKEHDIYIFASKIEACSNALLEALSCGLPAVAFNSSSNPEIIGSGGEFFETLNEIPDILDKIAANYLDFQRKIRLTSIDDVMKKYMDFMRIIYERSISGSYYPKRLNTMRLLTIMTKLLKYKLHGKLLKVSFVKK